MLAVVDDRLKQLRGNNLSFGGLSMIFVGDMFQLKPVFDEWIFDFPKFGSEVLAPSVWRDNVRLFELTTIMRQKDDESYAELLNRMREGNHTKADIELLKTRMVQPGSCVNIPHLCCLNSSVDEHNRHLYETAVKDGAEHAIVCAQHIAVESGEFAKKNLNQFLHSKKFDESCAGLPRVVPLAVGQEYEVSVNMAVDDGLMNGSPCVIMKLDYRRDEARKENIPDVVWVDFHDPRIGKKQKADYRDHHKRGIEPTWVPIFPIQKEFNFYHFRIARRQFPLRQSAAKTVHKSQGESKSEAVVDHTYRGSSQPHSHYVAFSRVTTLDGLHILNLHRKQKVVDGNVIFQDTSTPDGSFIKVDQKVRTEMARLREEGNKMELCFTPVYEHLSGMTITFQNVRSLRLHFSDLSADPNYISSDVFCCAETRLWKPDPDELYTLPTHNLLRFDQTNPVPAKRPAHGLAVYVKKYLDVLRTRSTCTDSYEWAYLTIRNDDDILQILVLYSSPSTSWRSFKQTALLDLCSVIDFHLPLIVTGDFNKLASDIQKYFTEVHSLQQLVNQPTTFYGSCIDLLFSNVDSDKLTSGVIDTCWSDHRFVWMNMSSE